jgi:mannose-6-phosphate isomerase-like protein (cupin superfamily)
VESSQRPWGSYEVLADEVDHKVKRIVVEPGKRLSYQRHARRSEHWFVLSGQGRFVLDDVESAVTAGQAVDIPAGSAHRIENTSGSEPLVFIEVQHGTYFGEDDIVRLDDDYGRAEAAGSGPR